MPSVSLICDDVFLVLEIRFEFGNEVMMTHCNFKVVRTNTEDDNFRGRRTLVERQGSFRESRVPFAQEMGRQNRSPSWDILECNLVVEIHVHEHRYFLARCE